MSSQDCEGDDDKFKVSLTIAIYTEENHTDDGALATVHVAQTAPTSLRTFAHSNDWQIIFYHPIHLRCLSIQLQLTTMLPLTVFEQLAPQLQRGIPGTVYSDGERLYACVGSGDKSTMEKPFVDKALTTILNWAKRKLNPTTFFYVANRSSLWHPLKIGQIFEGTEYRLVRHLISQKHSLYSPVDPGFVVKYGRGRLKQRVHQQRPRGELSMDEIYKGVKSLKAISADDTPDLEGDSEDDDDDDSDNDSTDIFLPRKQKTSKPRGKDCPKAASTPIKKKRERKRVVPTDENLEGPESPELIPSHRNQPTAVQGPNMLSGETMNQLAALVTKIVDEKLSQQTQTIQASQASQRLDERRLRHEVEFTSSQGHSPSKTHGSTPLTPPILIYKNDNVIGLQHYKGPSVLDAALAESRAHHINSRIPPEFGESSGTSTTSVYPKPAEKKRISPTIFEQETDTEDNDELTTRRREQDIHGKNEEVRQTEVSDDFTPSNAELSYILTTLEEWGETNVKDTSQLSVIEKQAAAEYIKTALNSLEKRRSTETEKEKEQCDEEVEKGKTHPRGTAILLQTLGDHYLPVLVGTMRKPRVGAGIAIRNSPAGAAFNTRSQKLMRSEQAKHILTTALKKKDNPTTSQKATQSDPKGKKRSASKDEAQTERDPRLRKRSNK